MPKVTYEIKITSTTRVKGVPESFYFQHLVTEALEKIAEEYGVESNIESSGLVKV